MFWWILAHNLSNPSLPRFTWKNTNAWVTVQMLCNPRKLKSPKIVYYVTTLSYEGILNDDIIKSASVLFQEIISLYVLRSNKKCSRFNNFSKYFFIWFWLKQFCYRNRVRTVTWQSHDEACHAIPSNLSRLLGNNGNRAWPITGWQQQSQM